MCLLRLHPWKGKMRYFILHQSNWNCYKIMYTAAVKWDIWDWEHLRLRQALHNFSIHWYIVAHFKNLFCILLILSHIFLLSGTTYILRKGNALPGHGTVASATLAFYRIKNTSFSKQALNLANQLRMHLIWWLGLFIMQRYVDFIVLIRCIRALKGCSIEVV